MISEKDNKTSYPYYNSAAAVNLNIIVKKLLSKWWLFLIVGFVAGLAGIYYASQQKIVYKSSLTFALDEGDGMSGAISLAAQFGLNLGSGKDVFSGDNITEIMKSRRLVERTLLAVDTFGGKPFTFIEYYLQQAEESPGKKRTIHFPVGQSRSSFTYSQDSLLYKCYNDFVKSHITAGRPDKKYNIYAVSVSNTDEKFTKDFTDKIVDETNKFYTEISTKKAKETLDVLEKRVAAMKGNVNSSISNRAETQDINLNPAFSAANVPILKEQANIQAYGGAYTEMFKNLEIARFQYLKEIPLMQIIDTADYPMEKIKMSKLKTGLIFSFIACFIAALIVWIISLSKLKTE